ncbi:ABC transporter permease [Halorussus gelatinilyticus]|uniref:ABC transporter permease n=1 Tax=Halorussus gelatinilyticus TaxID=2937524 RepID=A0A8U0ID09_9EURY|nr:ABC transporter permease [Halorussus gelatinilyticus]UPV98936.1 ABC transporter permease [Halorussus gelatinilyticus]
MRPLTKLRAVLGITVAQLTHERTRTVLAIFGIALAVLSTTLLASVGYGVVETGQQKFDASGRDLWITGGPVQLAPGSVGGFENTLTNAHGIARNLTAREDIRTAEPMAFQTVYVGTNPDDLQTIVGVGVRGTGSSGSAQITRGAGFTGPDRHYAGGSYDGKMTREILIGPRTANLLNVSVGDTIHVGGTVVSARQNEFTVIGISPTFSRFLGTPSVTLRLSELQELTGTTQTDPATMITIDLRSGVDTAAIEQELQQKYPQYDVRTNREQLQSILADKAVVLASGLVLVILAVLAGVALTANLLALLVYQQRQQLAAAKALGISSSVLIGTAASQGLLLGLLGGAVGLGITPFAGAGLNMVAARLVGFEGLVQTPDLVFGIGAVVAVGIGMIGSLVAGWRVGRVQPLTHLES